jgi:hypothetical protein
VALRLRVWVLATPGPQQIPSSGVRRISSREGGGSFVAVLVKVEIISSAVDFQHQGRAGCHLPCVSACVRSTVGWFGRCSVVRDANAAAKQAERQDLRAALATLAPSHQDERIQLHHAYCRRFRWPDGISCLASDPRWGQMVSYRWLARMGDALSGISSPSLSNPSNQ